MPGQTIKWFFEPTVTNYGFWEQGMEHFRGGRHENYLGRETIQNMLDAKPKDAEGPVIAKFKRLDIPISDAIPDLNFFKETLDLCLQYNRDRRQADAINFFSNAKDLLTKDTISVLVISDYNTKGLNGINEQNSRWDNLIRTEGSSVYDYDIGGGTFGIGKKAPFVVSGLRTVFYSTLNEQEHIGFAGKSIFTSHTRDDENRDSKGYYSLTNEREILAIKNEEKIPYFCRRDEMGLDLCVLAYSRSDGKIRGWIADIATSIMDNYFLAIHENDLEVEFSDETHGNNYHLNADNIYNEMKKRHRIKGDVENFPFFEAYLSPDTETPFEEKLEDLGNVKLFIKRDPEFGFKKVAHMRKPKMLVFKKNKTILQEPFAALFICENKSGNKALSKLEPPAHDMWVAERDPENGIRLLNQIKNFTNDSLRSLREQSSSHYTSIANIEQFLGYYDDELERSQEIDDDESIVPDNIATDWEPIETRPPRKPVRRAQVSEPGGGGQDEDEGGGGPGTGDGKGGNILGTGGPGPNEGSGGESQGITKIPNSVYSYRSYYDSNSDRYKILLRIKGLPRCHIYVSARGEHGGNEFPVEVSEAFDDNTNTALAIENNIIKNLQLEEEEKNISFQLTDSRKYAVNIDIYA